MTGWLSGKRILVTRPSRQAQGLVAAIEAQGGVALRYPVVDICELGEAEFDKQKVINLDHYDDLIVVSANAAQIALQWIDRYWPQIPEHLRWFAVGKASACKLQEYGVDVHTPETGFNSEALLSLPELDNVEGRRMLIFKGEGGRPLLRETLTSRGAQLETVDLYRRKSVDYQPDQLQLLFAEGQPDALIATSVDVLEAQHALLKPCIDNLYGLPLVAASGRIAQVATELGYQHVLIAADARDVSITSALNVIA